LLLLGVLLGVLAPRSSGQRCCSCRYCRSAHLLRSGSGAHLLLSWHERSHGLGGSVHG
jgi:hypothetical protein